MSRPYPVPDAAAARRVGGTPVGHMAELSAMEGWWIAALRLWDGGTAARVRLAENMTARFGPGRGERLLSRLGDLMELVACHARRPLVLRGPGEARTSADEAVLALLCTTATHGAREDAMLIACLMIRPDVAPIAVSLAQGLGLEIERGLRL